MRARLRNNLPRIVIVSPGYNCGTAVDMWFNSIRVQNYPNWIAIPIDDASTDDTYEKLKKIETLDNRVRAVHNDMHNYQVGNWYECIKKGNLDPFGIQDEDIIIFIDLDDWFGVRYAFEWIIKEFIYWDIDCLTGRTMQLNDYYNADGKLFTSRTDLLVAKDHQFNLLAYKAKMLRAIPDEHFIDPRTGTYYKVCGDYIITQPILWQAGPDHHHHLFQDNIIIYNNIRLENDDNKVTAEGISEHKAAWPFITQSFHNILKDLSQR